MTKIICQNCKKEVEHHAKNMCNVCYKKLCWEPKKVLCKRCGRSLPMHARGLCDGCYNSVFHIEAVKERNKRIYHNIDIGTYNKLTQRCIICDFNKIVELHHLDHNHKNNSEKNLIGVCPNHHKMIHNRKFREEIFKILREKGFSTPELYKNDEYFTKN